MVFVGILMVFVGCLWGVCGVFVGCLWESGAEQVYECMSVRENVCERECVTGCMCV